MKQGRRRVREARKSKLFKSKEEEEIQKQGRGIDREALRGREARKRRDKSVRK